METKENLTRKPNTSKTWKKKKERERDAKTRTKPATPNLARTRYIDKQKIQNGWQKQQKAIKHTVVIRVKIEVKQIKTNSTYAKT